MCSTPYSTSLSFDVVKMLLRVDPDDFDKKWNCRLILVQATLLGHTVTFTFTLTLQTHLHSSPGRILQSRKLSTPHRLPSPPNKVRKKFADAQSMAHDNKMGPIYSINPLYLLSFRFQYGGDHNSINCATRTLVQFIEGFAFGEPIVPTCLCGVYLPLNIGLGGLCSRAGPRMTLRDTKVLLAEVRIIVKFDGVTGLC